jgi:hypothetical protein
MREMLLFGISRAQSLADNGGGAGSDPRAARCAAGWMLVGLLELVCLALLAQPAVGQDRTPTPSGEELWKTYPLHPSPTPGPDATPVPSPPAARTQTRRTTGTSPDRSDPIPTVGLIFLTLATASAVLAVALLRRRRAAAAVEGSIDPRLTAPQESADHAPRAVSELPAPAPPTPPDPHRQWTATIQWRHADEDSRFCIVAEPAQGHGATVLAASEPLEWPPTSPASVRALGAATETLATALVSVGWHELPRGGEWYAKRFAWEPVPSAPIDPPASNRRGSSRFPRASRSEALQELWHCEIERDPRSASARLRAAVYPPGVGDARSIGSASAQGARHSALDPHDPECRAQVQDLATRLEDAGWERVARGPEWFAERFVWRREGTPPIPVGRGVPTEARLSG